MEQVDGKPRTPRQALRWIVGIGLYLVAFAVAVVPFDVPVAGGRVPCGPPVFYVVPDHEGPSGTIEEITAYERCTLGGLMRDLVAFGSAILGLVVLLQGTAAARRREDRDRR